MQILSRIRNWLKGLYSTKQKLLIITACSGAGKSTIIDHLLLNFTNFSFSVSSTTRSKREGEVNGVDYYFTTIEEFQKKIDKGAFIEWVEVYENQFYGTLKSEVRRIQKAGKIAIFDVDVKGAVMIKNHFGKGVFSIFIKPPDLETLERRLKNRKTETAQSLAKRIKRAKEELKYEKQFDYTLLNDNLDVALKEATSVVQKFLTT